MATRRKLAHDDETRRRIKVALLLNRAHKIAMGKEEATVQQVRCIEMLLRKRLPDLTSVEIGGEDGGPIVVTWQAPS